MNVTIAFKLYSVSHLIQKNYKEVNSIYKFSKTNSRGF